MKNFTQKNFCSKILIFSILILGFAVNNLYAKPRQGIVTIGSTGDFNSLSEAFTFYRDTAITGPLTLLLNESSYNDNSFVIYNIPGSSPTNTVTVTNGYFTQINYYLNTFNNDYGIDINYASNISFDGSFNKINFYVQNCSAAYTHVFKITSDIATPDSLVSIKNLIFTSHNSPGSCGIYMTQDRLAHKFITIENNEFVSPGNLICSYGAVVHKNSFYASENIDLIKCDSLICSGNTFNLTANATVHISDCNSYEFLGNKILRNDGGHGLYLDQNQVPAGKQALIANNFILINATSGTEAYGIRLGYQSNNHKIYNNTVVIAGNYSGNQINLYVDQTLSNLEVRNNNFVDVSSTPGLSLFSAPVVFLDSLALQNSGNNNIFTLTGNNRAKFGNTLCGPLYTLASQFGSGNISVKPTFESDYCHLKNTNWQLSNKGAYISIINKDIDGETRKTPPDIGADEFEGYTPVSGLISGTWNSDTIIITDDIIINSSLTIDSGKTIYVEDYSKAGKAISITVNGALYVNGTQNKMVSFLPVSEYWKGIIFSNTASPSSNINYANIITNLITTPGYDTCVTIIGVQGININNSRLTGTNALRLYNTKCTVFGSYLKSSEGRVISITAGAEPVIDSCMIVSYTGYALVHSLSSAPTFARCFFGDSTSTPIESAFIITVPTSKVLLFSKNFFQNCRPASIYRTSLGNVKFISNKYYTPRGIINFGSGKLDFNNNSVFYSFGATGNNIKQFRVGNTDSVPSIAPVANFFNNTVFTNNLADTFFYVGSTSIPKAAILRIRNSIIWGDYLNISSTNTYGSLDIKYSVAPYITGGTNKTTNPGFSNTSDGAYDLGFDSTSVCYNAGFDSITPAILGSVTDVNGKPRITGSKIDIGAHEYTKFLITSQPQNDTACINEYLTFSIEANKYITACAWQRNIGVEEKYSVADWSTVSTDQYFNLYLNSFDSGTYRCIVHHNSEVDTSAEFHLTVNTPPDVTISGPTTVKAFSTNTVYKTDKGMTGYEWNVNGGTLSNVIDSVVMINWDAKGKGRIFVNYLPSGCNNPSNAYLNVNIVDTTIDIKSRLGAWYPFNNNANDATGYGSNAVVTNAVMSPDRFGIPNSSYTFPTEGDIVCTYTSDSAEIDTFLTVCAWVKIGASIPHAMDIVKKQINPYGKGWRLFVDQTGRAIFTVSDGMYQIGNATDDTINDNKWHFIVGVREYSDVYIYDNVIAPNGSGGYEMPLNFINDTAAPLYLGSNFVGSLDDIRLYRRSLNPFEVDSLYKLESKPVLDTLKTSDADGQICNNAGTVTFTALPAGLTNYKFYLNDSLCQNGTSNQFTASNLNVGNYIPKVIATNYIGNIGKKELPSLSVIQSPTITAVSDTICGVGPVVLRSYPSIGNALWFDVPSGGSSIFTGNNYSTTANKTDTFYVEASNLGCTSNRSPVYVVVKTLPTITAVSDTICGAGPIILRSYPSTGNALWFDVPSGGSSFFTGNNYSTTANKTDTFYVEASNLGCNSNRIPVYVVVKTLPAITAVSDTICGAGPVILRSYPSIGNALWFDIPSGGSSFFTGNNYSTTANKTDTFYVEASNLGCNSNRIPVYVVVKTLPTISITRSNDNICPGTSVTLTASGANTYSWVGLGNGASQNINPTITTQYIVTGTSANGCSLTENIYVNVLPSISLSLTSTPLSMQNRGTITASATGGTGSLLYSLDGGISQTSNIFTGLDTGKFIVTVTDSKNCAVTNSTVVNRTGPICSANFTYSTDSLGKVSFKNSSSNVNVYYWNFGDEQSSIQLDPVNNYANAGLYNVCLSAYDSVNFCMSEICKEIVVPIKNTVTTYSSFTYTISNDTVKFNNLSENATNYYWTFGDGSFSIAKSPANKIYKKSGLYNVCLKVFNTTTGKTNTSCQEIIVGQDACTVKSSFSYVISDTVQFINKSTGQFDKYTWDFGDGGLSTDQNPSHKFLKEGYYSVTLSVMRSGTQCIDSYTEFVKIGDIACKADFDFVINETNDSVTFINKSNPSNGSYYWNFGDGGYSLSSNPKYKFRKGGLNTVTLAVSNSNQTCMDYISKQLQVGQAKCGAHFTYFIDNDSSAKFRNDAIGDATDYTWDFGDGTFSNETAPSHNYSNNGYYTVKLNTFNKYNGCMDAYSTTVLVGSEGIDCEADFMYLVNTSTKTAYFKDFSKGNIDKYTWDYGDGETVGNGINPSHVYRKSGYYNVCLTVVNKKNVPNMTCKWIEVATDTNSNCYADFLFNVNKDKKEVSLLSKSIGKPTKFEWDLGDDFTSTEKDSISHTYTASGYYLISLHITTASGCESFSYKLININEPNKLYAKFGYDAKHYSTKAGGYPVEFGGAGIGDNSRLRWNFGDGSENSTSMTPVHVYASPGTFNVCLEYSDTVSNQTIKTCKNITTQEKCQDDTEKPFVKCKDTTIVVLNGYIDIPVTSVEDSSYDDCAIFAKSLDNKRFTPENEGGNTIHLTVSDYNNNTATCEAIVTVKTSNDIKILNVAKGLKVYPNPVENYAIIRYVLEETLEIELSLFDLSGKRVSTIAAEKQSAGQQIVEFDASSLKSGSYILQLKTSAGIAKRTMLVKK